MSWFKVDDGLHGHPKALDAGLPALGLWVVAGSWSAHYRLDGEVHPTLGRLFHGQRQAEQLVAVGLWEPTAAGWRMHDFLDFNPSAEQVQAERDAGAERARLSRERRAAQNGAVR